MTILTKRFEIRWVIGAIFRQFKNMVAMAQVVLNGMKAVLTNALVALVNVLLELHPVVNLRTPVPGVSYIWDFRNCKERSHNSPRTITPHITSPNISLHLLNTTNPDAPNPISPCSNRPRPALAIKQDHAVQKRALTHQNVHCPSVHYLSTTYRLLILTAMKSLATHYQSTSRHTETHPTTNYPARPHSITPHSTLTTRIYL